MTTIKSKIFEIQIMHRKSEKEILTDFEGTNSENIIWTHKNQAQPIEPPRRIKCISTLSWMLIFHKRFRILLKNAISVPETMVETHKRSWTASTNKLSSTYRNHCTCIYSSRHEHRSPACRRERNTAHEFSSWEYEIISQQKTRGKDTGFRRQRKRSVNPEPLDRRSPGQRLL